ncbi:hypothetical protein GCM10027589_04410 [Actinocorallia lasiicapitis]
MTDEAISAQTEAGRPVCIIRQGRSYEVSVIEQWQEPGSGRRFRLRVEDQGVLAVADVVQYGRGFWLRGWWS